MSPSAFAFPLLTRAEVRLERGDGAGAERFAREGVRILRDALPQRHYATAVADCRVGASLALQGRFEEAEPLMEEALRTLRASERAAERYVRQCSETLAELLAATGRPDEAAEMRRAEVGPR